MALLLHSLGPDISVGLWYYSASSINSTPFKVSVNKTYNIKDKNGSIIAQIPGGTSTKIKYADNENLEIYDSISSTVVVNSNVNFDASDGNNTDLVFDVNRSDYVASDWHGVIDKYRGKIKLNYYRGPDIYNGNTGSTTTQIWVINTLPLEHYVCGDGELSGTGPLDITTEHCDNNCDAFAMDFKLLEYCQQVCGLAPVKVTSNCDGKKDLEKDYCLKDLAVTKKDSNLCDGILDANIRLTCQNRILEDALENQPKSNTLDF